MSEHDAGTHTVVYHCKGTCICSLTNRCTRVCMCTLDIPNRAPYTANAYGFSPTPRHNTASPPNLNIRGIHTPLLIRLLIVAETSNNLCTWVERLVSEHMQVLITMVYHYKGTCICLLTNPVEL